MISQKCKTLEEAMGKKDEEIKLLNDKVSEYETLTQRIQTVFEEKYRDL